TVHRANDALAVDLTNPDVAAGGRVVVPRGTLHLARDKFLWRGSCYERLRVRNYQPAAVRATLALRFDADYADIFEVRGTRRPARGRRLTTDLTDRTATLAYRGLDGVVRRTRLAFTPPPAALTADVARFDLELPPHGEATIHLTVTCAVESEEGQGTGDRGRSTTSPVPRPPSSVPLAFADARAAVAADLRTARDESCQVRGNNERFNDWVTRAASDLHMLVTQTPYGPYPDAGVPWFSTPFGRDGIITALECLWLNPGLARGVLAYLAATQATEISPAQDAQPGKILHETRGGEMAALGEIPFGRYYGSVDATPLFVMLAGAYYGRTGDRQFVKSIWPNVEAALRWCDEFGDPDRDGFVEYARQTPQGLVNQGWKDSHDAIFHADATLAEGPIALCEVQGYVYAARRSAAELARALGHPARADELERQADELRRRFEQAFWCEELGTYALALDGAKRPCRVRTSNPGHCLATGIADPDRGRRTAATLMHPDSFSGWGVRTVAATEANYNPMSYHNGSVWPHDNALIAWGLGRYGQAESALRILDGMFEASLYLDLHRLPELFCGFPRRPGEGPTLYPVACAPQAWAAAAVYLLVQSCLGLTVSGVKHEVCFNYPVLPEFLKALRIRDLRVGRASVDLLLRRHGPDVGLNVLRRDGDVQVVMVK
ncbi:MAG TPA: amylo-alpha-1,6-glucosidase, partial [Gemmataceae bacterium]